MSDFEKWFKTTEAYKMLEEQNYFKMDLFFFVWARKQYRHSSVQVAYLTWQHQQAIIDSLKAQLKTWKGKSLAAMLHGTCKCGEPWQSIVSDREGFNLLHCFNCNIDRYESKEIFGDHEIKAMRGDE